MNKTDLSAVNKVLKSIWPDLEIDRMIGKGSYASVYKVRHTGVSDSKFSAVKIIRVPIDQTNINMLKSKGLTYEESVKQIVEEYKNEIRIMLTLKKVKNVVHIIDYEIVKDPDGVNRFIFLRMELLTPLSTIVDSCSFTEQDIIKLGCDISTVLKECEELYIVHRDIKVDSILVEENGTYKLCDFGIAKIAGSRSFLMAQAKGALNYMAPEVAKGLDYDATIDLYSLGLVLYKLINDGKLPFITSENRDDQDENEKAYLRRINGEPIPRPAKGSRQLAEIILTACAYDPRKRYADASEFKRALIDLKNGSYDPSKYKYNGGKHMKYNDYNATQTVRKPSGSYNNEPTETGVQRFSRKNNAGKVIATVAAILAVVGVCIYLIPKAVNEDKTNSDTDSMISVNESATTNSIDDVVKDDGIIVDVYSDYDDQQIKSVVATADSKAKSKDYQGALLEVENALVTYPKSDALNEKKLEYQTAIEQRAKEEKLAKAQSKADEGDYISAINIIKKAQTAAPDDTDYKNALQTHQTSYKTALIAEADDLSDKGDHLGAKSKLKEAAAVIGSDSEIDDKVRAYEALYVSYVITMADDLLASKDYDGAEKAVNDALKEVPGNSDLNAELTKIADSRPMSSYAIMKLLDSCKITDSGTYKAYLGFDSINVFAQDVTSAFSINTAASYNMWGGGTQNVSFRVNDFPFDTLKFTICGESGTEGKVTISVFMDKPVNDGSPDYQFVLTDAPYPVNAQVDISKATTMAIRVDNSAGHTNRIVFYDFEGF